VNKLNKDICEILIDPQQIQAICQRLGQQITKDYQNNPPILVGLLKGCLPFMADLMRYIELPIETHYMTVSSYHGQTTSSGNVLVKYDLERAVVDQDILIIEDIIETGLTITTVIDLFLQRGAKSVKVVVLLDKPDGRLVNYQPAYVGQIIPNKFVIGYGLDYKELYRNLPYVGVLDPKIYKKE